MVIGLTYYFFSYFAIILAFYGFSNNLVKGNTRVIFYLISFLALNILRIIGQYEFEDIENYREIFSQVGTFWHGSFYDASIRDALNIDLGYLYLNSVFKSFGFSYEVFLFAIFVIQILIYYRFSNTFKVAPVISFAVYVSIMMMTFQIGMLRQALAFCFFLISLEFLDRKRIFVIFILIGSTFHLSLLFCISLIWVNKRINPTWFYFIFLISIFVYLNQINLFQALIPFFEGLSSLARVLFYLEVERPNNFLGIGFWERVLSFIAICLINVEITKKRLQTSHLNIIFNISVFTILFQILFASEPTILSRLRLYGQIFPLLYIGQYIFTMLKGHIYWLYRIPFLIYLSWYFTNQINYLIFAN